MVDDSQPQWIRTFPEEAAPRTGDGVFPGEVIEVTQVSMLHALGSCNVWERRFSCHEL